LSQNFQQKTFLIGNLKFSLEQIDFPARFL